MNNLQKKRGAIHDEKILIMAIVKVIHFFYGRGTILEFYPVSPGDQETFGEYFHEITTIHLYVEPLLDTENPVTDAILTYFHELGHHLDEHVANQSIQGFHPPAIQHEIFYLVDIIEAESAAWHYGREIIPVFLQEEFDHFNQENILSYQIELASL